MRRRNAASSKQNINLSKSGTPSDSCDYNKRERTLQGSYLKVLSHKSNGYLIYKYIHEIQCLNTDLRFEH